MTAPALSLALFDPDHELQLVARAGATLVFEAAAARPLEGEAVIEADGSGWRGSVADACEIALEPAAPAAEVDGARMTLCRARGRVLARDVACLAAVTETVAAPDWSGLDALREIAIVESEERALFLIATRPRGAAGHGAEIVDAALVSDGQVTAMEEARVSTVYDGSGRQQSAGLELWLPEEDFPRRVSGVAVAGSTLDLPGLTVNVGAFDWRIEGRRASGLYELTSRAEPPAAA